MLFCKSIGQEKKLVKEKNVDVARAKGAGIVIAVNISKNIQNPQIGSLIDAIIQSINIMGRELVISPEALIS